MTAYSRTWRRMVAEAIAAGASCADCGRERDLEGDHELAVALGGLSTRANLVIRCRFHNRRKGNRPLVRVQLTLDAAVAQLLSPAERTSEPSTGASSRVDRGRPPSAGQPLEAA